MLKYTLSIIIFMGTSLFINAQNNVLNLDGSEDYAFANDDTSFSITDAVTVAAWVKINSNGSVFSIARKGATLTPAYSLNKSGNTNRFLFWVNLGSWVSSPLSSTSTTVGEWYHIAGVYNGAEIMIYVNGVMEGSSSYSGPIPTTTDNFYIGGDVGSGVEWFNGLIDELSVWNKALTQTQIQTVMNDSLSAAYYETSDSGLVAYWKFDALEDLGVNSDGADDVRDLSIYGNHVDLEGDAFIEIGGPAAVETISNEIPTEYSLEQNYPNPFNPSTKIEYRIPEVSFVLLKVYDILGNEVATIVNQEQAAGVYRADFSGINLTSGTYFYKIQVGSFIETKKMILIK
ncbi:MAG: T9SS type A sorting domain-containing protein [Ignavibacteriaceae bacterium]|nr:T9SS type A sorting domain-containing protein [Ignavibacteriaceae bacterium]